MRSGSPGLPTLDALLRRHAAERPDDPALFDAPDRPLWSDGAPRRLSWAQAEAAVAALATRFASLGLSAGSAIALQGPNASDLILATLAGWRASLVAVMLPAGWRNREAGMAVDALGIRAVVTVARAGPDLPADRLRYVAAEHFTIRAVCAFGSEVPDGVVGLDDCLGGATAEAASAIDDAAAGALPDLADQTALVTWDAVAGSFFPVGRSHAELVALGAAWQAAFGLDGHHALLSPLSPASAATWGLALVPWLLSGCALVLHQGFDATVTGMQADRHAVSHMVLPQVVAEAALRDGLVSAPMRLARLVRRPDLAGPAPDGVLDAIALGELALLPLQAADDGRLALPLSSDGTQTRVEADGSLSVRGLGVPSTAMATRSGGPASPIIRDGWVATTLPARADGTVAIVTGPRPEVLSAGGHAYPLSSIEAVYAGTPGVLSLNAAAVPCPILGQRLELTAMPAPDADVVATSLILHAGTAGASPLAMTADAVIGDRRSPGRFAGAA